MNKEFNIGYIEQRFVVPFSYKVYFTQNLFHPDNTLLNDVVKSASGNIPVRSLILLDEELIQKTPDLPKQLDTYYHKFSKTFSSLIEPLILPGGEASKNNIQSIEKIADAINDNGICRHSFIIAIGGGALLDVAGYAASIAHRGIRLIRVPTTVLSQNDSGIGVKTGINYFNKKNFLGTFSPPFAVINDAAFLSTLEERDWRSGIAEAVKVALIKDEKFFSFLEDASSNLNQRDSSSMQYLIRRCAELHLSHIASGDPFEAGSSRPLDFGHWAAHKLEQFTNYSIRHGEAVAIGIALDSSYSFLKGHLKKEDLDRILSLLTTLGFKLFIPELTEAQGKKHSILNGLEEFREHLGGQLTVMLLEKIGKGIEVHEINNELMKEAIVSLEKYDKTFIKQEIQYVN